MKYLLPFLVCALFSMLATPVFRWLANRFNIVDKPDLVGRKKHGRVVAYLGGLAVGAAFLVGVFLYAGQISKIGVVVFGLVWIMLLGVLDDVYKLAPWQKLAGQIVAGLILVLGGIGIETIPLPMGYEIDLLGLSYDFSWGGWTGTIFIWQSLFTLGWTVFLLNALNFLDGVDGLASGVSMIAFLMIFLLSLADYVNQPEIALLAVMLVGGIVGFLPYNLPRASIFLGDSGSMMLGYMLAVLAILSGSKVATLVLVLGLGLIDSLAVVIDRIRHKRAIWQADRGHLHYKLIDAGWSDWAVILMYFGISVLFGLVAVLVPSSFGKMMAWLILFIYFILILFIGVNWLVKRKR